MALNLTNPKLLKEWNKIKNSNIFNSFVCFAEFYYSNGEKSCYRKFTNEPWSKENFFFGTYQDLLNFYKTDTTVSNSARSKIGKKFNALTILNIFAENTNGKKVIYAKCQCDCGNIAIKKFEDILKGDVRTCGCRNKLIHNIKYLDSNIIDLFWDFNKNVNIDPHKVNVNSTTKYWWKDKEGNSYQLEPYVFEKHETNTSFPEQAIYYYIKKHFSSAINRAHYITTQGEILELDIYIPTLRIGIEYDGLYWHKDKTESDNYKNHTLNNNGIFVIRIREDGLPLLNDFNGLIIKRSILGQSNKELVTVINQLFLFLQRFQKKKILQISTDNLYAEQNSIYALIYNHPVDNTIKNTCLSGFWDKKMNGNLNIENVSITSAIPIRFKCSAGVSFELSPKIIFERLSKRKTYDYDCFLNSSVMCAELRCCPFNNIAACAKGEHCLLRRAKRYPQLKCTSGNIFMEQKNLKELEKIFSYYSCTYEERLKITRKSFLRISFKNASPFNLSITGKRALLVLDNDYAIYDQNYFSNNIHSGNIIEANKYVTFKVYLTDKMQKLLCGNTLIVALNLFKEEYLHGWFYYIFLILKIDSSGTIVNQVSQIYSRDEFEGNLDVFRSHALNALHLLQKLQNGN